MLNRSFSDQTASSCFNTVPSPRQAAGWLPGLSLICPPGFFLISLLPCSETCPSSDSCPNLLALAFVAHSSASQSRLTPVHSPHQTAAPILCPFPGQSLSCSVLFIWLTRQLSFSCSDSVFMVQSCPLTSSDSCTDLLAFSCSLCLLGSVLSTYLIGQMHWPPGLFLLRLLPQGLILFTHLFSQLLSPGLFPLNLFPQGRVGPFQLQHSPGQLHAASQCLLLDI